MAGQVASPKLTPNVDGYESTPLESVGDLSKDAKTFMKKVTELENRFKKKRGGAVEKPEGKIQKTMVHRYIQIGQLSQKARTTRDYFEKENDLEQFTL